MTRRITLVEQPGGGYKIMTEEGPLDLGPLTAVVFDRNQAERRATQAAGQLMGPTELYWSSKPTFITAVEGQPLISVDHRSLQTGDVVFRMKGDQRIEGRVAELQGGPQGPPQADEDGNPLLVIHDDEGEIHEDLTAWALMPSFKMGQRVFKVESSRVIYGVVDWAVDEQGPRLGAQGNQLIAIRIAEGGRLQEDLTGWAPRQP